MKPLFSLLMTGLLRAAVNAAFLTAAVCLLTGAPVYFVYPIMFALRVFALSPHGVLGALSSDDLTDFATAFGAYYQPRGQNAERLRKLLMQDTTAFDKMFMTMPLEGDALEYALMDHSRVLQPFKAVWSPTGQLGGTPRKKTLRRVKVNIENIPDHLVNTWLGFLATEGGKDPNVNRATWPFVRWYIEKYLVPQAKEDQYYEGFYGIWVDPGTDATPGAHGTSLDGILVERNREIDNGDITPIVTGPLEEDPEAFVEQVEAFAEAFDNRYRGKMLTINMHDVFAQRFKEGLIEKNLLTPNEIKATALMTLPKRTNISIQGHFNWIEGEGGEPSEMLLCAPEGELFKGVRTGSKEGGPHKLEQVDYKIKLFNDWHILYGVLDPRICFTNDQGTEYGMD